MKRADHGTPARTLLLLRHAKSSWDDDSLDDFDRPLAARGRRDAPRMGRLLAAEGWRPDVVLCSPAARTRETWAAVADELENAPEARFPSALYMARVDDIVRQAHAVDDDARVVLLIGHNPGLHAAANALAGAADGRERDRLRRKMPTAALAVFGIDGSWNELGPGSARIERFVRPKDLPR